MVWQKDKAEFIDFGGQLKKHKVEIMSMKGIPKENRDAIIKFDERSQICLTSRIYNMVAFKLFLRHAPKKPFKRFDRDDFNEWLKVLREKYKPSTANNYIGDIKRLFRFVHGLDEEETPSCMKGIKHARIDYGEMEERLSKNILSKYEILQMIQVASNMKYKALIAVLFDGALRKSELMNIKIGD